MDIIADESVDHAIITILRSLGYSVFSVLEELPGITDDEVLDICNKFQCLLITEDKDFGELTYRLKKSHYGILLIRIADIPRSERIQIVVDVIHKERIRLSGNFSVLTEHGIRIKVKS